MKKVTIIALFILLVAPLFTYLTLIDYAHRPVDESPASYIIDIPKGTSFVKIVDILAQAGVVKHQLLFYLLALSQKSAHQIRAGEYEMMSSMSPLEVLKKLVRGEIKGYLVTFPEDVKLREMAARLASYKLVDEEAFMRLAADRQFIASLGIDSASLEGFLYPDTYLLDRSMDAKEIIKIMVNQFQKMISPEMRKRATEMGFTLEALVTLASIIGKESGNKEEKPLISAVFHNRLRKGMKLQSDPTAIYELHGFNGAIKRKDLQNNKPHNTYHIKGLPPSPIANPGKDSLQAALYPAPVNYLYFVSKKDGTHYFSANLRAHNEAVSRYQVSKEKETLAPDMPDTPEFPDRH